MSVHNKARESAPIVTFDPTATVLNIQRMSTEDGPGLRTTVFLKGCSLQCAWCHNPEAMCHQPQVVWHRQKCIGAHLCDGVCPEHALSHQDSAVRIDFAHCTACGDCVQQCPSGAFELLGTTWDLEPLVAEVARDRSYYDASGGGVTVSGGEPVLQARFVGAFFERCRAVGLRTALDTAGFVATSALLDLGRRTDLVLYDLKAIDTVAHACFTGQPNEKILTNVHALASSMRAEGTPRALWIRTPLIPGATLSHDNVTGIGRFIAEHLTDVVERWELCAFNNLAVDKYQRLGLQWAFAGVPLLSETELRQAADVARASGVDPTIVVATGPTRIDALAQPAAPARHSAAETVRAEA